MAYDIYGNNLKAGFCEVHPYVQQSYPCQLCYLETSRQDQQVDDRVQEEPNQHDQIHEEITSLRSEIEALRKEREWIPVSERLPEDPNELCIFGKWYPNWSRFTNIESMLWSEFQAHRSWELKNSYSHWQPLPPKP